MRLVKVIANLGYGSRKDVAWMFREGRITDDQGAVVYADDQVDTDRLRIDGEPLDPAAPLTLMLHKPIGYTCSLKDPGGIVYDLLPPRFRERSPTLACVGRLDRDTSGLLLMTDDGVLLQRIVHPKRKLAKIYEVTLARDLRGDEREIFASGQLMLEAERTPLMPAVLEVIAPREARITVTEGRYHQVRRMFAAVGNHVETLHRSQIGGLTLSGLACERWQIVDTALLQQLFAA